MNWHTTDDGGHGVVGSSVIGRNLSGAEVIGANINEPTAVE
jgi:hypothetical protein